MAAYAVMARIGRVDPHLMLSDAEPKVDRDGGASSGLTADAIDEAVALESDVASDPGPIAERLIRARELWRQTTFYLFDADSWRA
jgi:hypothetical protein